MIHYQLRCDAGHEFDGWFKNSSGFETQAASGFLTCPSCGSVEVSRALMAPAIPRKGAAPIIPGPPQTLSTPQTAGGALPDAVRAALQNLREEVEKNCDYVGADFAEEARRIHYGEAVPRGIYGESSDDDAELLAEDGIAFARIPWVPRNDS
ncbi:MAG: DUF1178 family protein [Proteobacteria bacterium]|nr:DUF1178 family protein [Pseudomonadota bacterium]